VGRDREHWKGVYKTVGVWPAARYNETEGSHSGSLILKSSPMYNKLGMFKASPAKKSTAV